MTTTAKPFEVFFTNFGYASDTRHATLEDAIAAARKAGFEASIRCNGEVVAAWSIFGGVRRYAR